MLMNTAAATRPSCRCPCRRRGPRSAGPQAAGTSASGTVRGTSGGRGATGGGRGIKARLQGMWHALPDDEKLRWGAEAPMVRGDSVERKPRGISIDGRDVSASRAGCSGTACSTCSRHWRRRSFCLRSRSRACGRWHLIWGGGDDASHKTCRSTSRTRRIVGNGTSTARGVPCRRCGTATRTGVLRLRAALRRGRVVGVYRRGSGVGFPLDGVDLGVAFEDVPRNVHASCASRRAACTDRGDAVRLAAGRPDPDERRAAAGPLDGRLVVQQFGPELDDWIDLRVNPRRTTVRTLRKLITPSSTRARRASAPSRPRPRSSTSTSSRPSRAQRRTHARARGRACCARASTTVPEPLGRRRRAPRPAARGGLSFLANGIQSRPITALT